jgi:hypothetical protein
MKQYMLAGLVGSLALVACNTTPQIAPVSARTLQSASGATLLNLQTAFGAPNVKLMVGPQTGRVVVFGLHGIPDGTVYTGIQGINWVSGAGDTSLQLEINQTEDFDVDIQTGPGNAQLQSKYIVPVGASTLVSPSISINTGAGRKKVEVQLESFTPNIQFDLIGNMGAGATEMKSELQFKQGSLNASANLDFRFSGTNNDKAEILIDNEARDLNIRLSPQLMRELTTKIMGDDPASAAKVLFAPVSQAGGSKLGFEMTSRAPNIDLGYDVLGGAGVDEVNLTLVTLDQATLNSNSQIALGQGNDKLELKFDGFDSNQNTFAGLFDLGGGNDEAKIEFKGTVIGGFQLDCGAGNDKAVGFANRMACEQN